MPNTDRRKSILVVEDNRNICRLLATYLNRDGFCVQIASDGRIGRITRSFAKRPEYRFGPLAVSRVDDEGRMSDGE